MSRDSLVLGVLIAIALAADALAVREQPNIRVLDGTWRSRVNERDPWVETRGLVSPKPGEGPYVWLQTDLPQMEVADPAFALDLVIPPFDVLIDDAVISRAPEPEGADSRRIIGTPWQLHRLPRDAAGKTLTLKLRARGFGLVIAGQPTFGERADIISDRLERDAVRVLIGLLIIVVGVLGFVVFVRRSDFKLSFGYVLSTASLGLYVLYYARIRDYVTGGAEAWFILWGVISQAMPIGILLFMSERFNDATLRRFMKLHLGYAGLLAITHPISWWLATEGPDPLQGVRLFMVTANGGRLLLLVSAIVLLVNMARRARKGDPDARVYLVGFVALSAFAVRDVLAALNAFAASWRSQAHVGVLALTGAFTLILARRFAQAQDKARMREQEKELLLRDLHDGVGSLTSNVRMLAELGRHNEARAARSLETIAELSGQALAELRAFVSTLDETQMSWDLLAAELRRFGAQLIESAGAELQMTIVLEEADAPHGLLALNLLRIYREALTNALKHGRATRVSVALKVERKQLSLTVENDTNTQTDAANMGLGTHRGINNMRHRAEELGGRLEFEVKDAARLQLVVPL